MIFTEGKAITIVGDANLFGYVGNNPINRVDPTGLFEEASGIGVPTQPLFPTAQSAGSNWIPASPNPESIAPYWESVYSATLTRNIAVTNGDFDISIRRQAGTFDVRIRFTANDATTKMSEGQKNCPEYTSLQMVQTVLVHNQDGAIVPDNNANARKATVPVGSSSAGWYIDRDWNRGGESVFWNEHVGGGTAANGRNRNNEANLG